MRKLLYILCGLLLLVLAQACLGDGEKINDNPFKPLPAGPIKVEYTANADTVFLKWTVNTEDKYETIDVSVPDAKRAKVFVTSDNEGYITHFPYNKATSISVKLLNGASEVASTKISANINGFDKTIAAKIIQDKAGAITSGDGMYSVALPDGRSIFLMGDSYNTQVTNGTHSKSSHMFRNSYLVYDPKTETATGIVDARGQGTNSSAAVVPGYPYENKWYWPGDGFVASDTLYIFQSVMYMGAEGMWGFRYQDSHVLKYSLPEIKLEEDIELKNKPLGNELMGAAALNDGDYIYVYQQCDMDSEFVPLTYAYVARTTEATIGSSWEFWDGSTWTYDQSKQASMEGASSICISSQFNVKKIRNKYVLFSENKSLMVGEVYSMTSDNPWGPWSHKKTLYTIPAMESSDWYTYNAMLHPQFEKDDMILFTIDVNTPNGDEQATNVASYRPVFIWIDINDIIN